MPWTNEPPLADAVVGLAAATCDAPSPGAGYRIYAIGGEDASSSLVATAAAYDTSAKTWSPISPMNTARDFLGATSGPGRLYALGGQTGYTFVDTHEIYDPAADAWSSAAPLPTARRMLAAVTGRDGLIYALGGQGSGGILGTVEAYDPATGAWTSKEPMPTPRILLAAVTGPDGLIYTIGGIGSTGAVNTVEVFDPTTNSWTTGPSLPAATMGLAAAVGPDGLIYAMGGNPSDGGPVDSVYSYNPATGGGWVQQAPLLTAQAFLAAATGPDGLIYAIGGVTGPQGQTALATVEAFTVATPQMAPDPYIGNGTYQTPDIILLDAANNPLPIGGAPGGAWDTLLQPNTYYGIQAVVYNDSTVAAADTTVRFWHFPGRVGTAGTLIDAQTVTVPANGSTVVTSGSPFLSGAPGQHECVAVSIANPESPYFSADPTTASEVIDPTVAHPPGSGHYGSAWRNTNSIVVGAGMGFVLNFPIGLERREPVPIGVSVTAAHVPVGWERTGTPAEVGNALKGACNDLRLPLFLVPELRKTLPAADLDLTIMANGTRDDVVRSPDRAKLSATVHARRDTQVTVSGTIPPDARTGDIYLVNIAAQYPRAGSHREAAVEYLEVIYVKE